MSRKYLGNWGNDMGRLRFVDDFFYRASEYDNETIAQRLQRPVSYEDDDGYTVKIWGGTIHPQKNWVAWIDYYEKGIRWIDCNYYLRAKIDGEILIDWTIETYNPFFGCTQGYFAWHDDKIILVYLEKHAVYGVTVSQQGLLEHHELGYLGTEFCVQDNIVIVRPVTPQGTNLQCYKLPNWEMLTSLSEEEALKMGILTEIEP